MKQAPPHTQCCRNPRHLPSTLQGLGGTEGSPRQIWPGVHRSPPLNKRFLVLFFALRVHTGEPSSPVAPQPSPSPHFHRLMPLTNRVFARTSSLHFDIHRYIHHSTPITVLCSVATRLVRKFGAELEIRRDPAAVFGLVPLPCNQ